jgi:predicted nucleotidyltransferase
VISGKQKLQPLGSNASQCKDEVHGLGVNQNELRGLLYVGHARFSAKSARIAAMVTNASNQTGRQRYYRYLPPNIPLSAIRRFARRIAKRFDPHKVILFGSFAGGKPHEYSDVDLLVVMPATNEINQAIRITMAFDREFPLDLIVRTPERLRRRLAQGDAFLSEVVAKGIVVYEKRNAILDKKSRRRPAGRSQRGGRTQSGKRRGGVPLRAGGGEIS